VFAPPAAFDPETSRRTFRIAATDNLELYVLPRLAGILGARAPGIDVRVSALAGDWVGALQRGEIDLKLGRSYALPKALESEDLGDDAFACVVRRGHPARARPTLRAWAGFDHLVIAPTAAPGQEPSGAIDAALAERGLRRRVAMTVPHFLVAPFVVARSDLVLTAPARLVAPFLRSLALRRIALPLPLAGYRLGQVWAARSGRDPGHRWLRATIVTCFAPRGT